MKKAFGFGGAAAACMAIAVLAVVLVLHGDHSEHRRIQENLNLGQKYLEELQFEQALTCFSAVINIDPMSVEAYLGAAEAYIRMGDTGNAAAIVRKGYEMTDDASLRRRYYRILRTNDVFYEELSGEDKALLSELVNAVLARDWSRAYRIQNGKDYLGIVDSLPLREDSGRRMVVFYPSEDVQVKIFKEPEEGEADNHVDIYCGSDGDGYFVCSVLNEGHYYMNAVPFRGGAANGSLISYNIGISGATESFYTVEGNIAAGVPDGELVYTQENGDVYRTGTLDGFYFRQAWPEALTDQEME